MNSLLQTLKSLGPGRLLAMGTMVIAMAVFFGWLATRGGISSSGMVLLYSDLASADAASITTQLDAEKIPYSMNSQGNTIMVPADDVGKVRMKLAQDGLPRGGNIGYEIFDQPEGFGTTSFVQDINHLRALEGELARTVGALDPVEQARVHLVLPHHELFSQVEQKASASVFLKLRSAGGLSKEQVVAIENLIAAAVPQLSPSEISIVDDHGNLLARPTSGDDAGLADTHEEMTRNFEQAQAQKIEDLLSKSLGYGRVRAQVSADIDYDHITTNSEIFDPDSQVVRSSQTVNESNASSEGGGNTGSVIGNPAAGGPVTAQNALPGAGGSGGAGGGETQTGTRETRTEETNNYEINRTVRNQVRDSGQIRKLSVAVIVDGDYTEDKDHKQVYKARTPEEMDQIKALVRSAVDLDETRGDTIEVANMRFTEPDIGESTSSTTDSLMGFSRSDILHLAETSILALVGLLVMVLVVRPLLRRAFEVSAISDMPGSHLLMAGAAQGQLAPPVGALARSATGEPNAAEEIEQMIDIGRVEGRVRASAVKTVGEIIDKHPEESVNILRNWMYQEK